ncbi:MAG: ABC transporter ATP-binding protein [Fuerstiella sp.]|nr:ABC transporter ATP-binding protein [Fuerstiella sp.]
MNHSSSEQTEYAARPQIRLTNLCAGFDGTAIVQIDSLEIASGEFVSLVGPSGCGKSTLLRIIAQLLAPASGELEISKPKDRRAIRTGFVFQDPTLLPWRTAAANIRLPGELEQSSVSSSRVHELAELVGLSQDDLQKRPAALSGGMKMRVSLARALVLQPDLLLLDEPFAAVDDLLRQQLQADVFRIQKNLGVTTVMVTHNVTEAVCMSDRVITLGGSPATITSVTTVQLDRSVEMRSTPEFGATIGRILEALRPPRCSVNES